MRKILLVSASAIALIAGGNLALSSAAFAQAMKNEGAQPAPLAQQSAPAEKVAPRDGAAPGAAPAQQGESPRGADQRVQERARDAKPDTKADSDTKADKEKANQRAGGKSDDAGKAAQDSKSDSKTTGQGAAGTSANLTTEQRTKIKTVIKQQNVRAVTNVNFSISVGARVPRGGGVTFYPMPATIIEIYPEWRGYEYILVGNDLIVINPRTNEIVDVIPV